MGKNYPIFDSSERILGKFFGMFVGWLDQHAIPMMDRYPTTLVVGGIIIAFLAIGISAITGPVWPVFAVVPSIAVSVATWVRYDTTH